MPEVQSEQSPIRTFRLTKATILVSAAIFAGLGCGGALPSQSRDPLSTAGQPSWIVSADGLAALRRSNAGLARRFFNNTRTLIASAPGEGTGVPIGYRSLATVTYPSLAQFSQDLQAARIAREVHAVIYDPEYWSRTPPAERRDPVAAMHQFTHLATSAGYKPIVAPGRDLVLDPAAACRKQPGELVDQAYLRCGLTSGAAGAAEFVIQAAPDELHRSSLRRLLQRVERRLRSSPAVKAIATLSTDPPGSHGAIWPVALVRAAELEFKFSRGILFNFTPTSVQLAASFLRDLERRDGDGGAL